jgi:hypothetical protein
LVPSDQSQDSAGFALITGDDLPDLHLDEIDHYHPSRPENVDIPGIVPGTTSRS